LNDIPARATPIANINRVIVASILDAGNNTEQPVGIRPPISSVFRAMSALGHKRTLTICLVAPLLVASATVPGLRLLRGSSDVVRAEIAKAPIARQNIASAVAVFERVILAIPINGTWVELDHRAPRTACPGLKLTDARAAAATKIVRIIIFLHAPVSNNTKEAVAISICGGRLNSHCAISSRKSGSRISVP
jgi:hypothetical protein